MLKCNISLIFLYQANSFIQLKLILQDVMLKADYIYIYINIYISQLLYPFLFVTLTLNCFSALVCLNQLMINILGQMLKFA